MGFAFLALLACLHNDEPAPHCATAERHAVATADGAGVVLHRHRAEGPPVLIVHGISSNHHCWDLQADRSLGTYLAERGFDAWLLDLRGHGDSLRDAAGRPQTAGWNIDDYGRFDLPAAIGAIRAETGAEKVAYVGHSLGGMVGAVYAGTVHGGADQLSALVLVGSPMDFTDADPMMGMALKMAALSGPFVPVVPSDLGASLVGAVGPTFVPIDEMLFNDLATHEVRRAMYRRVVSPLTGGELRQFGGIGETGRFKSRNLDLDYADALGGVDVPTLVIAGRADNVAPVDRVLPTYLASGATEKEFVIAGRSTGFAADYGHLDLTLGDHVREEIYPLIADWIAR